MAVTPVAQITLTLMSDSTLQITGPTENRMLFFGMVELAKAEVSQHHASRIVTASPADLLKGTPR